MRFALLPTPPACAARGGGGRRDRTPCTPIAARRARARRRSFIGATAAAATLPLLLGGCSDAGVPAGFGSLALLLVAAGGVGVGWLLARARLGARLHDAARQARLVPTLVGAELWRSDAGHRLSPGPLGDGDTLLWEAFDDGPATARLRQALTSRTTFEPLTLHRGGRACVVAAAPLFDREGDFEGHLGVTRAPADDGPCGRALAWIAEGSTGAVWVGVRQVGDGDRAWRVLAANGAARAHFGSADPLDDKALVAALPAPLQPAWTAGDDVGEGEGWRWQRAAIGDQCVAAVWQPGAAAPPADDGATLSYTVSHDLRAPIRVVEGFTRILKEDYGARLDRIANDHLDRVLGATARMNQMIDAMLTLAQLTSRPLTRQPVNLSQLAGWVVDDLRRASPERKAEVEIEPALHVHGDPTLLRLVLENLIGNAWKYSAQRKTARISLTRETLDGSPVFVVRDNGAGFDMRGADRLFGLFQRLHSASEFPGTGVGLASVRRIVQRHGGDVWATGEPDRGAAFHFTLRD